MDSQEFFKIRVIQTLGEMLDKQNSVRNNSERIFVDVIKSQTEEIVNVLIEIILCNLNLISASDITINNIRLLCLIIIRKIIKNEFFSIYFDEIEQDKKQITIRIIHKNIENLLNYLTVSENNSINQHLIELISVIWSVTKIRDSSNDIIYNFCKGVLGSIIDLNHIDICLRIIKLLCFTVVKSKEYYFELLATDFFNYMNLIYSEKIHISIRIMMMRYFLMYIHCFNKWEFINENFIKNLIFLTNQTISEKRFLELSKILNFIPKIINENESAFKPFLILFYNNLENVSKLITNKLDNQVLFKYIEIIGLIFRSFRENPSSLDPSIIEDILKILFRLMYSDLDKEIYKDWLEPVNLFDFTEDVENNLQTGINTFDNIFYAFSDKRFPLIQFRIYFEFGLQNKDSDWRIIYTALMILSHISEFINSFESMAYFLDSLLLLIRTSNNPKIVHSCFYALGIFSLESEDWFFENYEKTVTETFIYFFGKENYTANTNMSLQSFINFFEKSKRNDLLYMHQFDLFKYFFHNISHNKFVFIKEYSIKAISSCLICLKNRMIKENLYFIIESLIITANNYLQLENYENCKACILEAIFYCLDTIYKYGFNDLITEERLSSILKFLSMIQGYIVDYYDKQRFFLNKIWEKLLNNLKKTFTLTNNFDSMLSIVISLNELKNDEISNLNLGSEFNVEEDNLNENCEIFSPQKLLISGQGIFIILINEYKECLRNWENLNKILCLLRTYLFIKLSFDIRNNASFILCDYFEYIVSLRGELFKTEEVFIDFLNYFIQIYIDFFRIEEIIEFNYSLVKNFNQILQTTCKIMYFDKIKTDKLTTYLDYVNNNFQYYSNTTFDKNVKESNKSIAEKMLTICSNSFSQFLNFGNVLLIEKYYFNFVNSLCVNYLENEGYEIRDLGYKLLKNIIKYVTKSNLSAHKSIIHKYLININLESISYRYRAQILDSLYYFTLIENEQISEISSSLIGYLKEDFFEKMGKFSDFVKTKDLVRCCLGNLIFINNQYDFLFEWIIQLPFQSKSKKLVQQYKYLMNFIESYPRIILGENLNNTNAFLVLCKIFNTIYQNKSYTNEEINNKISVFFSNLLLTNKNLFDTCMNQVTNEKLRKNIINKYLSQNK